MIADTKQDQIENDSTRQIQPLSHTRLSRNKKTFKSPPYHNHHLKHSLYKRIAWLKYWKPLNKCNDVTKTTRNKSVDQNSCSNPHWPLINPEKTFALKPFLSLLWEIAIEHITRFKTNHVKRDTVSVLLNDAVCFYTGTIKRCVMMVRPYTWIEMLYLQKIQCI